VQKIKIKQKFSTKTSLRAKPLKLDDNVAMFNTEYSNERSSSKKRPKKTLKKSKEL